MEDWCITNDMLIGNAWFEHKNIHKIVYEVEVSGHKSVINSIIFNRNMRYAVKGIKVIRGAELNTRQRLVVADKFKKNCKNRKRTYMAIILEKLEQTNIRRKYANRITYKLVELEEDERRSTENWSVNE